MYVDSDAIFNRNSCGYCEVLLIFSMRVDMSVTTIRNRNRSFFYDILLKIIHKVLLFEL